MSTFERVYQTQEPTEKDFDRESLSMALSDQEYLLKVRRDMHALDVGIGTDPLVLVEQLKSESKPAKRKSRKK